MQEAEIPGEGDDATPTNGERKRSRAREIGQRGLAELKNRAGTGMSKLREHDNELIASTTQKTEQTISKTAEAANRSGQAVLGAAQRKVGLEDLVVELGANLESALIVIASQRDRIEQLEARLDRLERES